MEEHWVEEKFNRIGRDKSIYSIRYPGTENSGSDRIDFSVTDVNREGLSVKIARFLGPLAKWFVRNWYLNQSMSITEQFNLGVRSFNISYTYSAEKNELYNTNSYAIRKLTDVFDELWEIANSHKNEIITVGFYYDPKGTTNTIQQFHRLVRMGNELFFNSKLIDLVYVWEDEEEIPSYETVMNMGTNVIIASYADIKRGGKLYNYRKIEYFLGKDLSDSDNYMDGVITEIKEYNNPSGSTGYVVSTIPPRKGGEMYSYIIFLIFLGMGIVFAFSVIMLSILLWRRSWRMVKVFSFLGVISFIIMGVMLVTFFLIDWNLEKYTDTVRTEMPLKLKEEISGGDYSIISTDFVDSDFVSQVRMI
jgi:hypothetical protein